MTKSNVITITVAAGASPLRLSGSGGQSVSVGGVPGVQITWTDNGGGGTATLYCEFLNSAGQVVDVVSRAYTFRGGDSYTPQYAYSGSWASATLFAQDSNGNAVSPSYSVAAGSSAAPAPSSGGAVSISITQSGNTLTWHISGLTPYGGFTVDESTSQGFSDTFGYTASSSGTDSRAFNYGSGTSGDVVTLTATDDSTGQSASTSYTVS